MFSKFLLSAKSGVYARAFFKYNLYNAKCPQQIRGIYIVQTFVCDNLSHFCAYTCNQSIFTAHI